MKSSIVLLLMGLLFSLEACAPAVTVRYAWATNYQGDVVSLSVDKKVGIIRFRSRYTPKMAKIYLDGKLVINTTGPTGKLIMGLKDPYTARKPEGLIYSGDYLYARVEEYGTHTVGAWIYDLNRGEITALYYYSMSFTVSPSYPSSSLSGVWWEYVIDATY